MRETWRTRWYRRALSIAPAEFRARYEDEMVTSLDGLVAAEIARRGRLAGVVLWMRAIADAWRVARRERRHGRLRAPLLRGLSLDARYVWRSWRSAKAFAVASVAAISLGVGVGAAIFAFADGYLLRPLPFDNEDALYELRARGTIPGLITLDDWDVLQGRDVGQAGFARWTISYRGIGEVRVKDEWLVVGSFDVSERFAEVMGFGLPIGRPFRPDEHVAGAEAPCWVSHRFWLNHLGGSQDVIGTRLEVRGRRPLELRTVEVVGVLPKALSSFDLNNEPPDLVLPALPPEPVPAARRADRFVGPIMRLRAGVSAVQAQQRIQAVIDEVHDANPAVAPHTARLVSLRESLVRGGRPTATLLAALAGLLLVLVTLNVVQLNLARAMGRRHEVGLRIALGASRWRIARLLLVEGLMLGAAGLTLGLWVGATLTRAVAALVPQFPTNGRNLALVPMAFDLRVVAFSGALAISLALVGVLWPLLQHRRQGAIDIARAPGTARRVLKHRTSRVLMTVQVAAATVVLAVATLVGGSAWTFLRQPLGFSLDGLYRVHVSPAQDVAMDDDSRAVARRRLLRDLRSLGGVRGVGSGWPTGAIGRAEAGPGTSAVAADVDDGYFGALGLRLLRGRIFDAQDLAQQSLVTVVDDALATRAWPSVDPIGQRVVVGKADYIVVGVVSTAKRSLLSAAPGTAYVPQSSARAAGDGLILSVAGGARSTLRAAVADAVARVLPGSDVSLAPITREGLFLREVGEASFRGPIAAALGGLSVAVVGIGLFGTVLFLTAHRVREFGVRLALGASPADLGWTVLRQSLVTMAIGLAIGLTLGAAGLRWLRSVVPGVTADGMTTMTIVAAVMLAVACLAALLPVRRAMRTNPLDVLRAE